MSITNVFFILAFCVYLVYTKEEWNEIENHFASEDRNFRCCAQKLDCCKKTQEPTNFEVRALLIKCPQYQINHTNSCNGPTKKRQLGGKYSRSANEDYQVLNCKQKIKLTIKIKNSGKTYCKSQYILIDHVFDEISGQKKKLLYPYALKIKQQPVLQVYGLNFESMVNAKAAEKVFNKMDKGDYEQIIYC